MSDKKIVEGNCDICCKEKTKIYARIYKSYQKVWSGECLDCVISRRKYKEMGKPPNGFKFRTTTGVLWEITDQCNDGKSDSELVVWIQAPELKEVGMTLEYYKIWEGLNNGYWTIA